MAKTEYKIPFDQAGNQLDYPLSSRYIRTGAGPYNGHYEDPNDWRENFEFSDSLRFKSYSKGRSSITFFMERVSTGQGVTMFISDFTDALCHMNQGQISGRFTFIKKGTNYGCKLITTS